MRPLKPSGAVNLPEAARSILRLIKITAGTSTLGVSGNLQEGQGYQNHAKCRDFTGT